MDNDLSLFANRLKQIRDEKDMTLDEFSKLLDVPAQTINRYELSQRTPKVDVILKIAEKLNVSSDYLLGKTEYKNFEQLAAEVAQLETLEKYISSLGYKIKQPYIGGISGDSAEDAEKRAMEQDADPNFPCWEVMTDEGDAFTVTITEHKQLIERVKNLIIFELENIKNKGYFAEKKDK